MYVTVCEVQMNLSFVDSPDRANDVEYACLDRFVRSNDYGLLDNSVQKLSPLLYRQRTDKNKNEDYSFWYKVNLHFYRKKSG